MKRILPLIVIIILGALFAVHFLNPAPSAQQTAAQLPVLSLVTVDGTRLKLPITGKPIIVNVFASWCVPCAAEMPLLEQLATSLPVYGIAYKDQPQALAIYLKRYGNPFAAIAIDDGTASTQLGVTGVPESYLVDAQGRVVRHLPGMLDAAQLADWQAEIAQWH